MDSGGAKSENSCTSQGRFCTTHNSGLRCYTSTTRKNPNRRFFRCPHWEDQTCQTFQWLDPESSIRDKQVFEKLYKEIDANEERLLLKEVDKKELEVKLNEFEGKLARKRETIHRLKEERTKLITEYRKLSGQIVDRDARDRKIIIAMVIVSLCCLLYVQVMQGRNQNLKYLS